MSLANPNPHSLLHDVDLLFDVGRAPDQKLYPHRLRLNNLHGFLHRNYGLLSDSLLGDLPILAFEKG